MFHVTVLTRRNDGRTSKIILEVTRYDQCNQISDWLFTWTATSSQVAVRFLLLKVIFYSLNVRLLHLSVRAQSVKLQPFYRQNGWRSVVNDWRKFNEVQKFVMCQEISYSFLMRKHEILSSFNSFTVVRLTMDVWLLNRNRMLTAWLMQACTSEMQFCNPIWLLTFHSSVHERSACAFCICRMTSKSCTSYEITCVVRDHVVPHALDGIGSVVLGSS
jgi:hypothetical protein